MEALSANIKIVMNKEFACQCIRVYDDPKKPGHLIIIEYWDSEEIFTGPYMQTPHMKNFLKMAEAFLDSIAEFSFWCEIITTN